MNNIGEKGNLQVPLNGCFLIKDEEIHVCLITNLGY